MDFSFSTGGGAGTSIFDGVITEARRLEASLFAQAGGDFFNDSASSNAKGGMTVGGICSAGAFGDTGDAGGNLNFLFIDPFLLFLFSIFMFCMLCGVGMGAVALSSQTCRCPLEAHSFCIRIFIGFFWRWLKLAGSELVGGGGLVDEARGGWGARCGCVRGQWH
jgi:hypothetical protein